MILSAFAMAVAQMTDGRFIRVLLMGVGLTLLILLGLYAGLLSLIQFWFPESIRLPVIGTVEWVDDVFSWASIPVMLVLSIVLMVPVASVVTGLFLDRIADAVEARHYPHLSQAPRSSLADTVWDSASFLLVLIVANLLALVLYLIFAPFAPFIFYALNGFLLSREYFQLVAMRRIGRAGAKALRRRHIAAIWAAGVLMVIPLTVPVLNLLVPILGAATFTHLYHRVQAQASSPAYPNPAPK